MGSRHNPAGNLNPSILQLLSLPYHKNPPKPSPLQYCRHSPFLKPKTKNWPVNCNNSTPKNCMNFKKIWPESRNNFRWMSNLRDRAKWSKGRSRRKISFCHKKSNDWKGYLKEIRLNSQNGKTLPSKESCLSNWPAISMRLSKKNGTKSNSNILL